MGRSNNNIKALSRNGLHKFLYVLSRRRMEDVHWHDQSSMALIVLLIPPWWNSVRFSCYCSCTDLTSCHYLSTGCLPSRTCLSWDAHCPLRPPDFCLCLWFSEIFCSVLGVSKTFVHCMQSEVILGKVQTLEMEKSRSIKQVSCFSLKTFFWAII